MTPLHHSARNGHLQVAEFLIQSGASVDKKSVDGWTALHLTCENGHVDVIDLLLRQGADPNAMNKNHVTSLMLASREGHVPVIELLLKYGAKINKVAEGGKTALSFAARSGKVDVLRRLIKELKSKKMLNLTTSARPRTCDSLFFLRSTHSDETHTGTPLMHAAECGELEICKVLIEEISCDITKTEQFGREALHFAVEFEHLDCVKYLLSKGARVTHADSTENGTTPLAYACT